MPMKKYTGEILIHSIIYTLQAFYFSGHFDISARDVLFDRIARGREIPSANESWAIQVQGVLAIHRDK